MHRFRMAIVLAWLLTTASPLFAADSNAQSGRSDLPVVALDQHELALKEYQEWRGAIFDYDRRLYDRVLKINRKTILTFNVELIGFGVILISVLVLFWQLRKLRLSLSQGSQSSDGGAALAAARADAQYWRKAHGKLTHQLKSVEKTIETLEYGFTRLNQEITAFNRDCAPWHEMIAECRQAVAEMRTEAPRERT